MADRLEITRIDFIETSNGVVVNKLAWNGQRYIVTNGTTKTEEENPEFVLEEALAWCEKNGWSVRRWYGGARAFKGEPRVIRTTGQIKSLRERLKRYPVPGLQLHTIDLRYDY